MKTKSPRFFKRFKDSIINFDEYKTFLDEKTRVAIKYVLKIVLIFTIILAVALTYKIINEVNKIISEFQNQYPNFSFKDNVLVVEGNNKKIVNGDSAGYFGIILDSEKENVNEVEEFEDYQFIIAVLKDKIVIKNVDDSQTMMTYEDISQNYDLSSVSKDSIIQYLNGNSMMRLYVAITLTSFIYFYIAYLIQFLLDILLLSVIGYIVSKIVNIKLKYKSIFNLSVYSLTLSIILYLLYMVINLFTGFTIKYFQIAYNAIAYIYIITAMMTIKSDLMKQQVEVGKIVEEQKKVREEKNKEQEEKKSDKKEQKEEKKKEKTRKENKKEKPENRTPEGNEA